MTGSTIALVYFSATNVTATYSEAIHKALLRKNQKVDLINITAASTRIEASGLDAYDSLIFGFPVYSDLAPSVVNEWLTGLNGGGRKCAMFFTYGGRTTGYAHFHTYQLLTKAGFQVEFSAEFPGPHTFNIAGWTALTDRPSAEDLQAAAAYADLAITRFSAPQPSTFKLQKPFGYNRVIDLILSAPKKTERGWTNPTRVLDACDHCLLCETECPVNAFNAETGLSDFETCISCMHCVAVCPNHAIKINEGMKAAYQGFLADWNLTEEMMSAKQSRIITDAWQAAA